MKINFLWSLFFIILIFVVGFFLVKPSSSSVKLEPIEIPKTIQPATNIKFVKLAGVDIKVDLALTPAEQNQGLSGRTSLNGDEGMLFIFDLPGKYAFWMKDMNFPIDMIWLGEDMKVVYIKKNALPKNYPETYQPGKADGDAKYVLEVVSGFSDKNNLKVGDSAEFTY